MSNWFTRLFTGSEKRSLSYQDVWGSGADVSAIHGDGINTALTLVPVYAATRLLSDSIASLPLQTFRTAGDALQKTPSPPVLADPTGYGTPYNWVQRAVLSLALRGNAYGYHTEFDDMGFPVRTEWLHPDEVALYSEDRVGVKPVWYYRSRRIDDGRLLHIPGYVLPGRIVGLSPISAFASVTETGLLSQQYGRDWFRNGSVPSAVLETDQPVVQGDASIIKDRFRAAASGREPVVLGAGISYKPISVTPEESQFLATIKATKGDIASIYGIPPERIGGEASSSLTYANREQDALDLVSYGLRPYLINLEWAFSTLIPDSLVAKFNVDAIVRADLLTRYQAHHYALVDRWKTPDEVRELEDMPPLPNGEGASVAPLDSAKQGTETIKPPGKSTPVDRLRAVNS